MEHIECNYENYENIFTDGSKKIENEVTTACGIYIQRKKLSIAYKLRSEHSVVNSELYAIYKALQYIKQNL